MQVYGPNNIYIYIYITAPDGVTRKEEGLLELTRLITFKL
jgi:hypothetical protein